MNYFSIIQFLECGSSKKEEVPVDEDMEDADDLVNMISLNGKVEMGEVLQKLNNK